MKPSASVSEALNTGCNWTVQKENVPRGSGGHGWAKDYTRSSHPDGQNFYHFFFLKSAIVSRAKASVCKREKRENSHQDVNLQIPKQHIDKQMSQTPSVLRRKPAGGPAERADYHPIDWLVVVEYPELFREPRLEGRGAQTASSWRVFKFRLWNQPGVLVEHRVPEAQ